MPRVIYGTSQRREAAAAVRRRRTVDIITAAMAAARVSRNDLMEAAGLEKSALTRRMNGSVDFRADELAMIADILDMDTVTRAALVGGTERCQWEPVPKVSGRKAASA